MAVLDAGESEPQRAKPPAAGRAGIRLAAALMALLVLASIGGFLAHERWQTLAEATTLSERRAGRLANELGDALAVAAAAVQRTEARLEQLPVGEPLAGALAALAGLAAAHQPLLAALPMPLRVAALGADGGPLAADARAASERETLPTADGWQIGLTRGAAGSRSVPLLRRAASQRHGVAAFLVELDHAAVLTRFVASRTADGGVAALFRIDPDGSTVLLARAPWVEAEIGQRVRGPLAAAAARSPRGSFSAQTQLDQQHRILAYQRLDGEFAALVVAYGMATDQVLADWYSLLPWAAGAALLLLGGIAAGARRLETASQAQADQLLALQRSDHQFRALAANLPDVVVRFDAHGRHLFANPAVERATGLPPQAFIGKSNAELGMAADKVALWTACLQRVFGSGQSERLEFEFPGPDGPRNWESLVVREPLLPGAEPTALVISRDISERKAGEQALQLSEQRLREAQQLAAIGSWTLDMGSGALTWSEEVFRIFELDPDRSAPDYGHFLATIHPDDRAVVERAWQTAVAEHVDYAVTHRLLLPDGRIKHVQERGRCSYADDGTPLRALGTVQDVTTRVLAEQALRTSEASHREMFESNPHPMWVYDVQTLAFLSVNARAVQQYGWSREEFLRMTLADIRPPEDTQRLHESVARAPDGFEAAGLWRHCTRDGRVLDVEIHSHGLSFQGRAARLVLAHDVTRRTQAERALRDNEERLRLALQAAHQGLYDLDLRTGVAVVSPEYALMLGHDPADFHESNAAWRERMHPDDRSEVEQVYLDYVAGRRPDYRVEFRQRLRDGGWKWILSVGRIQERDAQGQPLRMLGTHTDMSAVKEAQAALQDSEARFRVLFDASPVPTLAYERGSLRLLAVNEAFTRLSGYSRDEALALRIPDLYPAEQRAYVVDLAARVQGLNHVTDIQYLHKDGRRIDVETRSHDYALDGRPGRISVIVDVTEQRRAEAERRAAAERFEKLFRAAPEAISVTLLDSGRFLLANDAFCELFAYPRERLIGRTSLELQIWADGQARETVVQRLHAGVAVQGHESRVRRGDGEIIDVLFSAERIELDGQDALLLMFRDISERKRLDAALQASEKRFRIAASFGQVWEWDFGDGGIAPSSEFFANLGHGNVLGAEQLLLFERIVPADDLRHMRETLRRHLRREGPYHLDFRARDAEGRLRWFETWGQALYDESGRARYIAGTTFEITERKEAEEQVRRLAAELEQRVQERTAQLAQSEARYRAIFDTVPISIGEEDWSAVQRLLRDLRRQGVQDGPGYFAARPDFVQECLRAVKLRRLNQKALALHEVRSPHADMSDLQALFPKPEDLPQFVDELEALWAGQRLFTARRSLPTTTGQPLSLMMSMSLPGMDDEDGTALVCLVDITEIDRLNAELDLSVERLSKVNRELETFTYSVSHDLKAPLRGIDGYSRLLLSDHGERLDSEGRLFLQHIRQATQQMGALIDDLLAYSRLERRELALAPVSLAAVVDAVLAGHRPALDAAGVQLEVRVDSALQARCDAQGLTMALRNLVDNAVKFSRTSVPPRITIAATRSKDGVELTVHDNGIGFDMKFHDRIFSIFQRLHRAEDYPGTGIGLAIVRKAMERMGGRVWADSRAGEGATFPLQLPEARPS